MEENPNQTQNTQGQAPVTPISGAETNPAERSSLPGAQAPKAKNSFTIILVIVVAIMAVVVGALFVLAASKTSQTNQTPQDTAIQTETVTPSQAPSPTPASEDINTLDLGDPQKDLDTINQDLQQL